SDPAQARGSSVTALFMILAICTIGMLSLPVVLGEFARRRWLLILILSLVNLYWCLRWIDIFARTLPMDAVYAQARHAIVRLMAVSSLAVIVLYQLADRLLRPRPAAPPQPPR
ncbi:MAG: hypothetical protein O3B24_10630, partial [Verrucomicrobia bacterium]|nr:hypothetical protein [Verrucomicrobiota bacterium]